MAKAYWVTTYRSISNPDKLAAYSALARPAVEAAGGKFLIRGMPAETWESGMKQRTVVVEFPDLKTALAAHGTPGYQAALQALGKGSVDRDMRVVEGAE
jgi:uncharacterized protein (DUF1330 family)